ncbi:M14 family metallopeptidase [uncultured Draconibacterium sp.]|uniref:M14 family metallopeptidase n=1 Tax=uncultured Draconibacterium sp. TaxID=1573823 RepID=UPI003216F8C2
MLKKLFNLLLSGFLLFSGNQLTAQTESVFNKYHTNDEIQKMLQKLESKQVKLHTIAESPGGQAITVLEIGADLKDVPAVFVGANFEGNVPLASEGAMYLAQMLLDSSVYTQNVKWYIMPQPNPDAAAGYFADVKYARSVNDYSINNDADEATNEDGFDDLNGDGLITKMRVKNLEGSYIISKHNALIMDKADGKKGERGEYKLYSEGIDNDGDGEYNEDGEGGINIGIAFPHLFPYGNDEAGLYTGQSSEVYGIMRFIFDRPEIAMVYTLGTSNFCAVPPKGGRKGGANLEKIKIPARYGRMFDVDVSKTYTMDEVIELFKAFVPAGMEVTPSMVAGYLGLGAAVNPQEDDLVFYKKYSEDYKKYLKAKNFNTETLDAAPAKDGSFELWAYYHLGVPSFSMNLFSIPKVKEEKAEGGESVSMDKVEKMSTEDFIALGNEKIDAFLKANNAPDKFKAEGVVKMMESGRVTPKQMVGMLKEMPKPEKEGELSEKDKALLAYSEKELGGKGFVEWTKVKHPKFGEVEVGGYVPYLETTPKPESIDSLASVQLPWLLQLSTKLPKLEIESQKVTEMGGGIYKLEIFVANNGDLSYPISMGDRNKQPAPVILILDGDFSLLEGKKRTQVVTLGANQVKKLSWLIQKGKNNTATATLQSVVFTDDVKQFNIGG